MIILLSPSKTLEETVPYADITPTQPQLMAQTEALAKVMKQHYAQDICELMSVSKKLGELNYQRYQNFTTPFTNSNARPCIFTFKGDVYDGLEIEDFDAPALSRAQKHIRILSGLYGLLRPFDFMQPYRLEMGTKLATDKGKNLYEFWGDQITELLNKELAESGSEQIINLASNEYFKAVNPKKLAGELITPLFKERKGNALKVIGIHAKKARGMMARHLTLHQGKLESFAEAGYAFDAELSKDGEKVFVR
jgi:cytoplasmic iron level regulating protein YaaA (DUF328/UPF0246 family)